MCWSVDAGDAGWVALRGGVGDGMKWSSLRKRTRERKSPRRDIGASYYAGICEDVDTPIIRGTEPLVIEDVVDGFPERKKP